MLVYLCNVVDFAQINLMSNRLRALASGDEVDRKNVVVIMYSDVVGKCVDTVLILDIFGEFCQRNSCCMPKNPRVHKNSGAMLQE